MIWNNVLTLLQHQPKFLTKEDRAKAALERRKNEIDKLKASQEDDKKRNIEYMQAAKQASGSLE